MQNCVVLLSKWHEPIWTKEDPGSKPTQEPSGSQTSTWGQLSPWQSFHTSLPHHYHVSRFFLSSAINSCHHTVLILLFLPLQMDTKSNTQTNSFMRYCAIARITYLSPKDSTQAACHVAQRQLQNRYFMAALLYSARCFFVQTGAVTNTCLGLLLCILRTKHSAPGRIF